MKPGLVKLIKAQEFALAGKSSGWSVPGCCGKPFALRCEAVSPPRGQSPQRSSPTVTAPRELLSPRGNHGAPLSAPSEQSARRVCARQGNALVNPSELKIPCGTTPAGGCRTSIVAGGIPALKPSLQPRVPHGFTLLAFPSLCLPPPRRESALSPPRCPFEPRINSKEESTPGQADGTEDLHVLLPQTAFVSGPDSYKIHTGAAPRLPDGLRGHTRPHLPASPLTCFARSPSRPAKPLLSNTRLLCLAGECPAPFPRHQEGGDSTKPFPSISSPPREASRPL